MESIQIPRTIINQILAHAQCSAEEEICGLISEKNGSVQRCYPIHNVATNPVALYRMDGKEQIDAMRQMRENNENLFAIYHSHPHSEAYPSATDLSEAQYPDVVYIIVSLNTKGVLDLRAYKLNGTQITPLEISL